MPEFFSPEWFKLLWQMLAFMTPGLFLGAFISAAVTTPLPERGKGKASWKHFATRR